MAFYLADANVSYTTFGSFKLKEATVLVLQIRSNSDNLGRISHISP